MSRQRPKPIVARVIEVPRFALNLLLSAELAQLLVVLDASFDGLDDACVGPAWAPPRRVRLVSERAWPGLAWLGLGWLHEREQRGYPAAASSMRSGCVGVGARVKPPSMGAGTCWFLTCARYRSRPLTTPPAATGASASTSRARRSRRAYGR
jgi:hypothetical protein